MALSNRRSGGGVFPRAGERLTLFVYRGEELVALLYLDLDPRFGSPLGLERLGQRARIVAQEEPAAPCRHEGWQAYLESTPVEQIERERLLLLLNRNEWNIARVARLMGVTRRTIYLRLRRYKLPRERVPKTPPRRAAAGLS